MTELAVIVPSRGRPHQLAELLAAIRATAVTYPVVYVGLDYDDPADYVRACPGLDEPDVHVYQLPRRSLSAWTNLLARHAMGAAKPARYLASLGDDHRPRTAGWDKRLIGAIEALGAPGIAYGDDRYKGVALPTAWVVSAEVVERVGWMMLPACQHMYVDNAVLALGQASGRIVYCPDVVIEHMHPLAGKAELDETYLESGSTAWLEADRAAFLEWQRGGGLARDVAKLTGGVRR